METFRSLVVVPRSHTDGTQKELKRRHAAVTTGLTSAQKLGTIHVEFSVTSDKIGGDDKWSAAILSRAVQLDLRPVAPLASTYVIWDARLIHQGHEFDHSSSTASDDDVSNGWFSPPIHRPPTFSKEDVSAWKVFLAEEGYAVLRDVVTASDCLTAGTHLSSDVGRIWSEAKNEPVPLSEVRDCMLPQFDNTGIRMGSGLPNGEFAWFLRCHESVRRVWAMLYPPEKYGHFLRGTIGSPALTPPKMSAPPPPPPPPPLLPSEGKGAKKQKGEQQKKQDAKNNQKKKKKGVSGEWLHVDYSPPEESGLLMYQSTLYLNPDLCVDTNAEEPHKLERRTAKGSTVNGGGGSSSGGGGDGSGSSGSGSSGSGMGAGSWGRLGLMVSMAPPLLDSDQDRLVESLLLAAALRGDGAKATAGLAFGLLQPLSPYPPKRPKGSVQRLVPLLRHGVTDETEVPCLKGSGRTGGACIKVGKLRLMPPTSKTAGGGIVSLVSVETLRTLVHPRAKILISRPDCKAVSTAAGHSGDDCGDDCGGGDSSSCSGVGGGAGRSAGGSAGSGGGGEANSSNSKKRGGGGDYEVERAKHAKR